MTYMKCTENGNVPCTTEECAEIAAREMAWEAGRARRDALAQIAALEAQVTQRRLREAVLTPEGSDWLENIENQIATLRGGLSD